MTDSKLVRLVQERLGAVDDAVIEAAAEAFFPETSPQPEPPPEPAPQAVPEPETLSREDFLQYHIRRENNPEQFAKVTEKMRAWAALHPEDERKWDTNYAEFNRAYDSFNRDITKTEHRVRYGTDLKFKDELDAESSARQAEEEAAARQAEEEAEVARMKADLAEAYKTRDHQRVEELEGFFAARLLGTLPRRKPEPPQRKVENAPPERKLSYWEVMRNTR